MQPLRRKYVHKRSDNFKVILNQFFYGRKQVVPDDVMNALGNQIHDKTNILYKYTIPIMIPILECILKRNKMMKYKGCVYYMLFKLNNQIFAHITTKERNKLLDVFNVVRSIYDKYKPHLKESFLNYYFVLKKILTILGKIEYAKYIPLLKTHSKQKELERI